MQNESEQTDPQKEDVVKPTLLIADRNRHVRDFLKREFVAEGYQVELAKSACEVLKRVFEHGPLDLLILDPNLPDAGNAAIFEKLNDRIPTLPVVVHTFLEDYRDQTPELRATVLVEKKGSSIEHLKRVVSLFIEESKPWSSHARHKGGKNSSE